MSSPPANGKPDDDSRQSVRLRLATDADWHVIRRWLAEPDIIRWWGPKATTEAEVMIALASPQAICRIIECDGTPVGYGHALDAGNWGEPLPPGLDPGTWDIDLFVASPAHRGRGVGVRALELMRDEIFSTTLAPAACVFVTVGNEHAVRAYERAGFHWRSVVRDKVKGPEWLMIAERPARTRLV
jgi:RimJ/RimL family protein N-acetyltransferase